MTYRLPVKLAVVSHTLPPDASGQALMIERLFREFHPDDYCLVSRGTTPSTLPAASFHLPPEPQLQRPSRFGTIKIRRAFNEWLRVVSRARNIARIARREKCRAIIGYTGDLHDWPAAYLAARILRIPFFAYVMDDYLYQWPSGEQREFARRVEPYIVKGASGLIVPNEFARDEYRGRYNAEATIIRNMRAVADTQSPEQWPAVSGEVSIVFTGNIYHAHFDAFRNLLRAIESVGEHVSLHVYTPQMPEALEREGLRGPVVYHPPVSPGAAFAAQCQADILFLPLAFDSTIPEVIRTSAPGKIGEYLCAGRPVLAHAPADSYVSWFFREHGCGVVADESDAAKLADSIRRIIEDPELRRKVVENARARAGDFGPEIARERFLKLLRSRIDG